MELHNLDLNLLVDLDALLSAGSVAGAARRRNVSAPAMSRRLGHLRDALGDPLFVLAGRRLEPTTRALELKPRLGAALEVLHALLAPPSVDLASLERTLTLRANDGFFPLWAADIVARVSAKAPRLRLRFSQRADKDPEALRSGEVDLDLGVLSRAGPEIKAQRLFEARYLGVVRQGHPLQGHARVTPEDLTLWAHVAASRLGLATGPLDDELAKLGLRREVRVVTPGYAAAMAIAARSDLIASVPIHFARWAAQTSAIYLFEMPVVEPPAIISMGWHPRQDADLAHRLLRAEVRETLRFEK